jgi:Zn-dependent protease with chaperone function
MELVALGLLVLGVALAEPISRRLAVAQWPERDPVGALLLWQAIGLAGGLALLGAGAVYGLAPLGSPLPASATAIGTLADGRLPAGLGAPQVVALLLTLALAIRLLSVLAAVTLRTMRVRARHRDLLDLLGTPWPAAPGARVLDHPVPVAYCLPGMRSRLVVSAGVLDCLDVGEVWAVLAHERAHLRERHDLVVLPFVAWGATAPFVRGMVCAQLAVAALIEMRADDVAVRQASPEQLSEALVAMGGSAPAAALSSFTSALDRRLHRIIEPPAPLPVAVRVLVRLVAAVLVAVPVAAVLL